MIEIRTARASDIATLRWIFIAASLSNVGDRDQLLANPDVLVWPPGGVDEGRTRVAVAPDGSVVGFTTLAPSDDVVEIEDLFVHPDWMGQGIGRTLVSDVVATADASGARSVEVTANEHARGFYDKLGFVFDREVRTRFRTAPRLRLDLRPPRLEPGSGHQAP